MTNTPPCMKADDKVILFDGVCKLCNAWSHFIIQHDRQGVFKLASVQSPEGQAILEHFSMPTDIFDTMLLVEGPRKYEKSEAFLRIVSQLPAPWKFLRSLNIIPTPIRDWAYDRIALNRYRLFGKHKYCMLPKPEHSHRFLDEQQQSKL